MSDQQKDKTRPICLCNSVSREVVEEAIQQGARTINEIFDLTEAGVGACGGSCRPKLQSLLDGYLKNGVFPENLPLTKRILKRTQRTKS